MLRDVEDCVENLQIRQADIAALHGQTVRDSPVLSLGDLHGRSVHGLMTIVLTRPSPVCLVRGDSGSWLGAPTSNIGPYCEEEQQRQRPEAPEISTRV